MLDDDKPPLEELALAHYGVKGMRWGVRKDRPGGVSRKVARQATGDAKEYVRAKAYYGEGAGTRRKLIKQTVEGRTKRYGSGYKKIFDREVANQDTAVAVTKAKRKRSRTDKANTAKKTSKAAARQITGQAGNAGALVAAGVIGYKYLQTPQGRAQKARTINTIRNSPVAREGSRLASDLLKNFR